MTFPNESNLPELQATLAKNSSGVTAAATANGFAYFQGLSGGGTPPVLAAGAGAGTSPTLASQKGHDLGGSVSLTIGSTPGAGALITVTFGTALSAAPAAILLSAWDTTGAVGVAVGSTSRSATGFTISGPSITAAHVVQIDWLVLYN